MESYLRVISSMVDSVKQLNTRRKLFLASRMTGLMAGRSPKKTRDN